MVFKIPTIGTSKEIDYVDLQSLAAGAESAAKKLKDQGLSDAEVICQMLGDQSGKDASRNRMAAAEAKWCLGWMQEVEKS